MAIANAFAKEVPTTNEPINPGPRVNAIASISSFLIPAFLIAASTTGIIFCWCARLANSGTTPPYNSCISCLAIKLERMVLFLSTAADVSSHDDSIARMIISF